MNRSVPTAAAPALLGAVVLAAVTVLAGCGSAPAGSTAAPATATASTAPTVVAIGPDTAEGVVPTLGADATDLTKAPTIPAGAGKPPTQLLTHDVVVGKGTAATPADTVNVRYVGALYDGTPFDSSWSHGDAPATFPLSRVVPGFAQGITGMAPGGRRVIVIPPALGYGADTNGPIPGGSTLVFVVDLVSVA